MLEQLLVWERDLFLFLNGSNSAFLDRFMWLYSGKAVWLPLAVFIIGWLWYKKSWKEPLLILLAIALTITLCDQFASHLCKPLFTRFRPTHHPDFMEQVKVVFGYRGGKYGFISSHAANAFGFATFMTLLLKNRLVGWTLFAWAFLTAYSRIYLGVHFISDVVPGALSGLVFGYAVFQIYNYGRHEWLPQAIAPDRIYSHTEKHLLASAIWLTVLAIALLNEPLVHCLR